ncbi:DNA polymerase kappa [Chloropicon primus]|uniref:DNA polymerase kappa n=1 Tax=Chloropicon primus TaxID=1764295 RepID=A0A5B8MUC2_9CHLO|nr:DNA polymerase kappa [Chloropicon primus]UPR03127.1 DNA polymerase kappa [Chloropicon primus]|mmetsp:Transcript_13553/g.38129  ORF Transcript_13553/g.38129 Transcript_13553/m.38129 type:complete len:538 (-) Transcript_13553:85-1698(-)|eukprot:QDZ23916.1 DNA polymerase kappa [Chloropicon primus]
MGTAKEKEDSGGEGWRSYESVFTNRKAGMADVDRDRIKKIVFEASKDSPHFKNEQRKEQAAAKRLSELQSKARSLLPRQLDGFKAKAKRAIVELEASRDLSRTWFHIDMDAFFAACHVLDRPELDRVPMAVGGNAMISTANYAARKFGVRSAMPGFIALKLCPQLTFVRSDFAKYKKKAEEVRAVLARYDENFIEGGLDEAYLDVTRYLEGAKLTEEELAEKIRDDVFVETSLTCSIGGAANRMLAKICSDLNKPNGQYILERKRKAILEFVSDLPVRKIPGIGKVTEKVLKGLGMNVASDLVKEAGLILALFSKISFESFLRAGLGISSSEAVGAAQDDQDAGRKGISCERTFGSLRGSRLESQLKEIVETLSSQMTVKNLKGKHITVKMKKVDFTLKTKSRALPAHTCNADEMMEAAAKLVDFKEPLRLIGVRMAEFEHEAHVERGQKVIDLPKAEKRKEGEEGLQGGQWFCDKCSRWVELEGRLEHEDFHLAQDLHREQLTLSSKPKGRGRKPATGMSTMDFFVQRKKKKAGEG